MLTKADLLTSSDLLKSMMIVNDDIEYYKLKSAAKKEAKESELSEVSEKSSSETKELVRGVHHDNYIWPVSSSTGAGINNLWHKIRLTAESDSLPFVNERSKFSPL